jgi:class 3 adenylate cyclase/CHAT domain-containing protein
MSDREKPGELDEILRKRAKLDEMLDARFKRPATILFTDIVGSTTLFSTRGDIEGRLMIQRHNDLLIPLLDQYQGTLIDTIGDAILAAFEEPSHAVVCAVKMQEALAQHNQGRTEKEHILVRIGINQGLGYVEAHHVYGIVVNIAERIKSLAGAYQILISESVYQALNPGTAPLCTFLDKVRVKGVEEEIKVYQVVWRQEQREEGLRRNALRVGSAGGDLVLEASRENGHVKVCVYERGEGSERTLKPYESLEVSWDQVEANRREVIGLLNRANRRAKITPEILESLKKSGQILFDLLIPPKAREKIGATDAKNLILSVDDKLVHIPWELLFDGKQFLCRRFAMGRIVSTRQAPTSQSSRASKAPFKVLVVADPRGDLEASYREGMEIKSFLDEKRDVFHVDFKSHPVDIPFVKKNLRDYDIVHYAGHADYHSDNPSESGWLLKDGRLKASEISAMGGLQPMPSLVFSNACQSGHTGEWRIQEEYEQQIYGLANAYLLAGVQHYIGTFWEILDEPSCFFAKRFYSFLAQGMKVGEAVRRARQDSIDAYGEETIVWATYMLYGDPTFEFSLAEKEASAKPARVKAPQVEWSQVMRGEERPDLSGETKTAGHPYLYSLIGALVLGLAYLGYQFYYSGEEPAQQSASVSTVQAPVTPVEAEKKVEVPEIAEPKSPPVVAALKKSAEPVKAKDQPAPAKGQEVASVSKAAEVPAAPVAKPQEPPPAVVVPDQVAVAKASPATAIAAPLTLKMNIIGQRKEADGSYTEVLVSEGSVLRSLDNFQVHLEANRPTYVHILMYDSQGKASQIFPDPKIDQPGFVEAGRKLVVPARDLWFWLDENTGTETIYVLASEKPMSDLRGLLAKMEGGDEAGQKRASQEIKERIAVMQRGVGGITKGQAVTYTLSDGKKIEKVTDVVAGTGSVVRAVSFLHR